MTRVSFTCLLLYITINDWHLSKDIMFNRYINNREWDWFNFSSLWLKFLWFPQTRLEIWELRYLLNCWYFHKYSYNMHKVHDMNDEEKCNFLGGRRRQSTRKENSRETEKMSGNKATHIFINLSHYFAIFIFSLQQFFTISSGCRCRCRHKQKKITFLKAR